MNTVPKDAYSLETFAYIKLQNVWAYLLSQVSIDALHLVGDAKNSLVEFVDYELISISSADAMMRYCGHCGTE